MQCLRCRNIFSEDGMFCGQCGTPKTHSAPTNGNSPSAFMPPGSPNSYPINGTFNHIHTISARPISSSAPAMVQHVQPTKIRQQTAVAPFAASQHPGTSLPPGFVSRSQSEHASKKNQYRHPAYSGTIRPGTTNRQAQDQIVLTICFFLALAFIVVLCVTISINTHEHVVAKQATHRHTNTHGSSTQLTLAAKPTPGADLGFTWCGSDCFNYGFQEEYPTSWHFNTLPTSNGIVFLNPDQTNETATFKNQAETTMPADILLSTEIQTNYGTRTGFQSSLARATTISGETWEAADVIYQGDRQQTVHVTVYTTVHQHKAFIIVLQAPETHSAQAFIDYYQKMIGMFQFT